MPTNAVALSRLLIAERHSLMRKLRRMMAGSEDAAEDVAQSLWLRIQRVENHPPILCKRAYLFRLATNMAIDTIRSRQRRDALHTEAMSLLHDGVDHLSSERIVLARNELDGIRHAIDLLPEQTRRIFTLSRMERLTQREIAARLGISRPTVEKHLRHAFDAMAAAISTES